MVTNLISTYTRTQALADGVLVDVSEVAKTVGIEYTTLMSAGLWNHQAIDRDPENVAWALRDGKFAWYTTQSQGPVPGEYTQWVDLRNYSKMLDMKIVVERSSESGSLLLIYMHFEEQIDFRCPRAPRSSLFLM
jgi:hypothetical protein